MGHFAYYTAANNAIAFLYTLVLMSVKAHKIACFCETPYFFGYCERKEMIVKSKQAEKANLQF